MNGTLVILKIQTCTDMKLGVLILLVRLSQWWMCLSGTGGRLRSGVFM